MRVQKKSSKKRLIIILSIVGVLLIGGGMYAYVARPFSSDISDDSSSKNTDKKDKKDETSDDSSESADTNTSIDQTAPSQPRETEKDIQPDYEGSNPNTSASLTGAINYKSVSGGNLVIRTTINQLLTSGTCTLTLTNGSKTVTRSTNIAQNPSSSTCQGFDVPTSELGSGTWSISIAIASGDKTGTLSDNVSL